MTATHELSRLEREASEKRGAQREAELEAARVRQAHDDTKQALVEAHATGGAKEIKAAETALTKARAAVEETEVRSQAAQLRRERAERDAETFRRDSASELINELEDAAAAATGSLEGARDQLITGDRQWREVSAQVTQLVRATGGEPQRDTHDQHGFEELVRLARRAQGTEPRSPLPHYQHQRLLQQQDERNKAVREQRKSRHVIAQAFSTPASSGDKAA